MKRKIGSVLIFVASLTAVSVAAMGQLSAKSAESSYFCGPGNCSSDAQCINACPYCVSSRCSATP